MIHYELFPEQQNERVVNELYVASAAASETLRFKPPHKIEDHGSTVNGINWIDGHMEYTELHTVVNEAVARFAHLYSHGVSKCTFLARLTGRKIQILEYVNCLPGGSFNHDRWLPCLATSFPNSLAQPKPRIFSTIV